MDTTIQPEEYAVEYFLPAGECNPQGRLPLNLLAAKIIDTATQHANRLGVGYERLIADGTAWVLSRLSIEMARWPEVNQTYRVETWVENFNRHFSERDFAVTDADGRVLGYARSTWMAIDLRRRQGADIALLEPLRHAVNPRECPVDRPPRLGAVEGDRVSGYTFRYTDCDFNRHVNTVRYIELLLNQWDMDFFDAHQVGRFDIAFHHEACFGQSVEVAVTADSAAPDTYLCEIRGEQGVTTRARFRFAATAGAND